MICWPLSHSKVQDIFKNKQAHADLLQAALPSTLIIWSRFPRLHQIRPDPSLNMRIEAAVRIQLVRL
jgi:hypothetical protein